MKYILFLALFLFPLSASAYLDPGTGSFIFQMIIAGLAGLALTSKAWWQKLKGMIDRRIDRRRKHDEQESEK